MKVLIVEDDAEGAAFLAHGIAERGHEADVARNGRDGLVMATGPQRYDVVIVDRMLPELDGLSLVKAMRAAGSAIPTLFLTSLSGIDDRVEGLEAGGDDYLVKPFAFSELMARLAALARRPTLGAEPTVLAVTVKRGGHEIDLQPREFQLLEFLMRSEGRVVTRSMLLEKVWAFHFDPQTNIVETHISRLRAKVDRGQATPLILTLRGAGYMLRASN
jgi:two-component system OmpR family response regulator